MNRAFPLILLATAVLGTANSMAQNLSYVSSLFWSEPVDLKASGDYLYCAHKTGLEVYDISQPESSRVVSQHYLPETTNGIALDQMFAYLVNYYDGLIIFDISDPSNPTLVSITESIPYNNIFIAGDSAYMVDSFAGSGRWDIYLSSVRHLGSS